MFDSFHRTISRRGRGLHGNKLRGVIVSIKDPLNLGRIQVRARDIHDDIQDEHLPWSLPSDGFGAGQSGVGKRGAPRVGTTVFLNHQDDSPYHPQWEEGPATTDRQLDGLDQDTPGHIDEAGNLHKREYGENNDKNIVTNSHQSGTGTVTDTDGNHTVNVVKDLTHNVFGDSTHVNAGNKTETTYGDTHTIKGKGTLVLDFASVVFKTPTIQGPMPTPGPEHKDPGSAPSAPKALPKPSYNAPSGTTY